MPPDKQKKKSANNEQEKRRTKETDPISIRDFGSVVPCKFCWTANQGMLTGDNGTFAVACKTCGIMGFESDSTEAAIWIWNQEMMILSRQ
jgi:hypothetical protein